MNKKLGETKQFLSRAKTLKMIIVQLNSIFAQEHVFQTSSKFFEYYIPSSKWKKKKNLTHSSRRNFKNMKM